MTNDAPRVVDVPDDLARALDEHPTIKEFFEALPFTHRKEYVNWINEAKKDDTRDRRVTKTIVMLKERIKRP